MNRQGQPAALTVFRGRELGGQNAQLLLVFLRVVEETGQLDRAGGAAGEVFGQSQVSRQEVVLGLGADEGESAEGLVPARQRDNHARQARACPRPPSLMRERGEGVPK